MVPVRIFTKSHHQISAFHGTLDFRGGNFRRGVLSDHSIQSQDRLELFVAHEFTCEHLPVQLIPVQLDEIKRGQLISFAHPMNEATHSVTESRRGIIVRKLSVVE